MTTGRPGNKRRVRSLAGICVALLLAAGGFGLAGCSQGKNEPGGGVNPKPVSPTSGSAGTKAPTPTPTTTAG